jgi:hypothetical protein
MARSGGPISRGRERDRRESGVLPNTHHGDVLPQHEEPSDDKSAWVGVRKRGLNGSDKVQRIT